MTPVLSDLAAEVLSSPLQVYVFFEFVPIFSLIELALYSTQSSYDWTLSYYLVRSTSHRVRAGDAVTCLHINKPAVGCGVDRVARVGLSLASYRAKKKTKEPPLILGRCFLLYGVYTIFPEQKYLPVTCISLVYKSRRFAQFC